MTSAFSSGSAFASSKSSTTSSCPSCAASWRAVYPSCDMCVRYQHCISTTANMNTPHLHMQKDMKYVTPLMSIGEGNYGTHEPSTTLKLYTLLVVSTVAPALRSFLTTLERPLEDAIISAVFPYCEEVEGGIGRLITIPEL